MIDLATEKLVTLVQAAQVRPPGRGGRPTHPSTIYRWISRGIRGHKLEAIRLGGTLYTSHEALQRFADGLTSGAAQIGPESPERSPSSSSKTTAQMTTEQLKRRDI
jgi:Protein of unknown function (DUF1580)